MKKLLLAPAMADVVLYAIQFILLPQIYDNIIGRGNESIAILCITTVAVTAAVAILFADKIRGWLFGLIIYAVLIALYSPKGAYGIGIIGLDLDGLQSHYDSSERLFGIGVVVLIVLMVQLLTLCLIKLSKLIIGKVKK
jgi:hypothetical protein